jgi:hypothetical protein
MLSVKPWQPNVMRGMCLSQRLAVAHANTQQHINIYTQLFANT